MKKNFKTLIFTHFILLMSNSVSSADSYNSAEVRRSYDQNQQKNWLVSVGVGGLVSPKYEGGNEYDFIPVPFIDVNYKDRVSFNPFNGLRFNFLYKKSLELGVGLTADYGRDEDDDAHLKGLGDVDATVEGQLFVHYKYRMASADLTFFYDLADGHGGYTFDIEGAYVFPILLQFFLSPSISTTYASKDYMNSYFGINTIQSRQSGLIQFDSKQGFKDVSGKLFSRYKIDSNWALNGFTKYSYLTGYASDSPVIKSKNQFSVGAFVSYSFD